MKIVAIGDLHITNQKSDGFKVLNSFLNSDSVKSADHIVFLGDIFDLMVGNHCEYFKKFDFFFISIANLIRTEKEVHYLDGNHDFHLKKLFEKFISDYQLDREKFHYHCDAFSIKGVPQIYFGHGDELEYYNLKYQIYTRFIRSAVMGFLISVVPYFIIVWIGGFSSKASRKRGAKKIYVIGGKERAEKFKSTCLRFLEISEFKKIICGHSHFEADEKIGNKQYLNAGHSSRNGKFIVIEDDDGYIKNL